MKRRVRHDRDFSVESRKLEKGTWFPFRRIEELMRMEHKEMMRALGAFE